jgi:hypothetical protein
MADTSRTIKLKLDADAAGLVAATKLAEHEVDNLSKSTDNMGKSMSKVSKITDAHANAIGRLRVAQLRQEEVQKRSNPSAAAVAAAEESVKSAERAVKKFEAAGNDSGRGWVKGVLHWFTGAGKDLEKAAQAGAEDVNAGFVGVLKTPVIGPAIIAAVLAAAVAVAVPAGSVVAGGLVAGAGAGLAGIGLKFAAQSTVVKQIWAETTADLGAQMRTISKPFESTLISMAAVAKRTFAQFSPELASAFQTMAPAVTRFGDQLGKAFGKLAPAVQPLGKAFSAVLDTLGPAAQSAIGNVSKKLVELANSVSKSPGALADMVKGVGKITGDLIGFLTTLNNANESFRRFTGGVSGVQVIMGVLRGILIAVIGPIELVLKGLGYLGDAMNWLAGKLGIGTQVADQTADALKKAGIEAGQMGDEAKQTAPTVDNLASKIQRQTAATNSLITSMHQMSGLALTLRGSQTSYAQAVADATAAIKANGKGLDINTQKGRDNRNALDGVASAANAQTDAMIKAGSGSQAAATKAEESRKNFVNLAVQMGLTRGAAKSLAAQLIDIPNVKRTVTIAEVVSKQYAPVISGKLDYYGHPIAGAKASGGPVSAGRSYLVGEQGPEILTMGGSGQIMNARQTAAALSGGGDIIIYATLDGGEPIQARIDKTIRTNNRNLKRTVGAR